ncbi:MAG: hypothetical protein ACYTF1_18305 [Planctomycetota bacterium]
MTPNRKTTNTRPLPAVTTPTGKPTATMQATQPASSPGTWSYKPPVHKMAGWDTVMLGEYRGEEVFSLESALGRS